MEEWKSLDFLGYSNYQISTYGRIKSRGLLRKISPDRDGYPIVMLYSYNRGKNFKVHRLVALAFISNPNDLPKVHHKDEDPSNPHVDNLEWTTNKVNCRCSSRATITLAMAEQIRADYKPYVRGHGIKDLMVKYNTTSNIIQNIMYAKCWN